MPREHSFHHLAAVEARQRADARAAERDAMVGHRYVIGEPRCDHGFARSACPSCSGLAA